jgi:hypothetical protein
MRKLADDILIIIGDYQNDNNVQLTSQDIIDWSNQFDDGDRKFILQEMLHLLNQGIYLSRVKAKALLKERIKEFTEHYKYQSVNSFLNETIFLDLQQAGKSQGAILELLDEVLKENYKTKLSDCGGKSHKNFIYLDDGINTGNTVFKQLSVWLKEQDGNVTRLISVNNKSIRLIVSAFYYHTWSWENLRWRLKKDLNSDEILNRIEMFFDYEIQNHPRRQNQQYNLAYPVQGQPPKIKAFLQNLHEGARNHEDKAFRPSNKPGKELFFSNPENRNRFERILLDKGITILNKVEKIYYQHRPLGDGLPSYKTFGTGTLYFTWRNISNTCPLVFWWKGHDWKGLFPVKNRGLN